MSARNSIARSCLESGVITEPSLLPTAVQAIAHAANPPRHYAATAEDLPEPGGSVADIPLRRERPPPQGSLPRSAPGSVVRQPARRTSPASSSLHHFVR